LVRLHESIGNQAVGRLLQAKLRINQPNDKYEQEADRVAEQVLQMKEASCACGGSCTHCKDKKKNLVQRKATVSSSQRSADEVNENILSYMGSGQPLDTATLGFMEPRFGHSFRNVSVHADEQAGVAARTIGARAFTLGHNVVFGAGEYEPHSPKGRTLLAHELAHVVQQRQSDSPQIQTQPDDGIRRIGVYRGVPDFLECELADVKADPSTSCCKKETLDQLPKFYAEARTHTDRAIERMAKGANMDDAITRHFGAGALTHRGEILANLRTIRRELDQERSHHPVCRIGLIKDESMDLFSQLDRALFCRFGVIASATRGSKILTLCVDLDGNPSGGWRVILHESAHFSGVALLPSREDATAAQTSAGEYETYEGEPKYPNPMPYALRDADSYASFVRDISGETWTEEPNPAAFAPTLEVGGALTLEEHPRPGFSGRLLWTPLGSNLQMIAGVGGVWLPGLGGAEAAHPPAPTGLRAYAGAEIGLRWIVGGDRVQFVLDVAGGGGPYVTVDNAVDPALAARLGLGVRFGGPQMGFGISADVIRLFHLSEGELVGGRAEDWLGGLVLRGHWGGSSARPR
jgi:hypothetical protein